MAHAPIGGEPADLPPPESTKSFWHSEPSPLLQGYRSTRTLPDEVEVIIIGAGLAGAGALRYLYEPYRSGGHELDAEDVPTSLLLEAREVCWGATGRNGGHCQAQVYGHAEDPEIGRFEILNYATVASLAGGDVPLSSEKPWFPAVPRPRTTFECEFVQQPVYHAYYGEREAEVVREKVDELKRRDPDVATHCQILSESDTEREARLATADTVVKVDVAARLWPYKLVAGIFEDILLDARLHDKINLQTWTPVTKIEEQHDGHWKVKTDRGTVKAKYVILATNAHTSHLLPDYADLIIPCRGTMSALKPPAEVAGDSRLNASYGFDGITIDDYLIQRPNEDGGHLMYGGGITYGRALYNADDSTLDPRAVQYLQTELPLLFGLKDKTLLEFTNAWTGIMGYTKDKLAFVGPVPEKKNLYLAAGFNGHGMPNAFLSGKAVALVIAAQRKGKSLQDSVDEARKRTLLPKSYLITKERLERARRDPSSLQWQPADQHLLVAGQRQ